MTAHDFASPTSPSGRCSTHSARSTASIPTAAAELERRSPPRSAATPPPTTQTIERRRRRCSRAIRANSRFTNDILLLVNKAKGGNLTNTQMISAIDGAAGVLHTPAVIDTPLRVRRETARLGPDAAPQGNWTGTPTGYAYQWKRGATNVGTNVVDLHHRPRATSAPASAASSPRPTPPARRAAPLSNQIAWRDAEHGRDRPDRQPALVDAAGRRADGRAWRSPAGRRRGRPSRRPAWTSRPGSHYLTQMFNPGLGERPSPANMPSPAQRDGGTRRRSTTAINAGIVPPAPAQPPAPQPSAAARPMAARHHAAHQAFRRAACRFSRVRSRPARSPSSQAPQAAPSAQAATSLGLQGAAA